MVSVLSNLYIFIWDHVAFNNSNDTVDLYLHFIPFKELSNMTDTNMTDTSGHVLLSLLSMYRNEAK